MVVTNDFALARRIFQSPFIIFLIYHTQDFITRVDTEVDDDKISSFMVLFGFYSTRSTWIAEKPNREAAAVA